MKSQIKVYHPFAGKYDPCTPIAEKSFVTPPQLFFDYQPEDLKQYSPKEALRKGTLWPDLFSPYESKRE
ncbi:spore coat associated protein CotJA [Paenibacillus sp. UNC451MF]|uniref:spore coat associated protein CotJA n=1 Tax=Paenibacillus sp. UNC451MF TaxID=1449063 RepID=UPI00048B11F0|nr:spore coat associated protein CotJA [Paenibacillus sp. UNC451MF]